MEKKKKIEPTPKPMPPKEMPKDATKPQPKDVKKPEAPRPQPPKTPEPPRS